MNVKSLSLKLAGGLAVVGLMATAIFMPSGKADACNNCGGPPISDPGNIPPQGPVQLLKKPDVVVWFDKAECGGTTVQLKIRVQNMANDPTWNAISTRVLMDGALVAVANNPHVTAAPLWGGQVYHLNFQASPGGHTIVAITDADGVQPELNEMNNSAVAKIVCS